MNKYFLLLILLTLFVSCSNNKKPALSDSVSIHKIWEFKKLVDRGAAVNDSGSTWIGENQLDLRNKDTLRFSYTSTKAHPTSYGYTLNHDTIFVQKVPSYKVLKLTGTELELAALFKSDVKLVMVYEAK